jgi:S1-C subfamily serine protease
MRDIGSRRLAWFVIAGWLAVLTAAQCVPAEATTARGLGTQREGNGILIGDQGLVLTIGYLIVEAEAIEVEGRRGSLPADFVAYDANTGFGLLRARGLLGARPLPLGDSSRISTLLRPSPGSGAPPSSTTAAWWASAPSSPPSSCPAWAACPATCSCRSTC